MSTTLGDLIVKIGADIQGFKDAMSSVLGSVDSLGASMASAGAAMSALTAPIALFGTAATAAAMDFESAMKTIRAGTGETGTALEDLGATFSHVFSSVPASAHDAAEAITIVFQRMTDANGAKLAGAQLEAFSTQILNLARITHSELQPLAETVTRVFKDWGMSVEQSSTSMDFLFKTMQANGVSITKMTENLVNFGAPLRALGFDFETSAAMIGRFEKEGVPLTTALAAMRFAIANFAKGGLDAKEALAATIDAIKNASTSADQMSIGLTTVGKRGMTDFVDAVKMGRFDLDEFTKSIKDNKETINDAAGATMKFAEEWKLLKNQFEVAVQPIGDTILKSLEGSMKSGVIKEFIDEIHSLAESFAALEPSTQAMIIGLSGALVAVGPIMIAFGALAASVAALGGVAVVATGAIAILAAAIAAIEIKGLVESVSDFVSTLGKWADATFGAAQSLGNLGDTAAKTGGVIGALGTAFTFVKDIIGGWFDFVFSLPWKEILFPFVAIKEGIDAVTIALKHSMGDWSDMAFAMNAATKAGRDFMSAQAANAQGGTAISDQVNKIKDSVTQAAIQFKLAKGAWEQLTHEQSTGAATSLQVENALGRLRVAAAAAGVDISKLTGDQKAAKDAAKDAAAALREEEAAQKAIASAMENLQAEDGTKAVTQQIDKLTSSLHTIFQQYQAGRVSLDAYSQANVDFGHRLQDLDAIQQREADKLANVLPNAYGKFIADLKAKSLEQVQIVTSTFSQMESGAASMGASVIQQLKSLNPAVLNSFSTLSDGFNQATIDVAEKAAEMGQQVAARIKQVFADIKDVGNIFQAIGGTEADANKTLEQLDTVLQRARDIYNANRANLTGQALETQNDLARIESDGAEKRIAIDRKYGKDVSDVQIAAANQMKVAWTTAHMDIEQAQKTLGVVSTQQYADQVTVATAAYEKIKNSALSSEQDILKGQAALYADQLAAQQANGDRVTEIQKAHLAKMQELALQGQNDWASKVDKLAVDAGKAMSKGMDNIIESFLAGKLSLKKAWDEMLTELTTAFVTAFISPTTKRISEFLANTMSELLGGKGFGGAIAAAKSLSQALSGSGEVAKEISGIGAVGATTSALGGVSQVGNAVGSGEAVANAVSGASGAASSAGGAASAAGGIGSSLGGIANIANIAGAVTSALSGIVSGVQQAHANSLLDKIEKSTREISTVTWQTGDESLQGLLKRIWLDTQQMVGRLEDIGTDLIVAVNASLEAINNTLRTTIYQALTGTQAAAQSTDTATQQVADNTATTAAAATNTATATAAAAQGIADATASATAAADAMSEGLSSVANTTATASDAVAQTVQNSGDTVAAAVTDSGVVVASAVSAASQIAGLTASQMIDQLNAIGANGGAFTNAYTDLKTAVIGSKTYLDALAKQIADNKAAQDAANAKAASVGKTALELGGFDNPGSFIPRSGDTSNIDFGPQGMGAVKSSIADFSVPASLPNISPGIIQSAPNYLVPPADSRTMAPGSASYMSSRNPAPVSYTGGIGPTTVQFINQGVITADQYKDDIARYIQTEITKGGG